MTRGTWLAQFVALFVFWLLLSDQYNLLFLGIGLASAALVTAVTHELFLGAISDQPSHGRHIVRRAWRFGVYAGWLLWRILVASVQVAYFVAHPNPPLQPRLLRFTTTMKRPVARVILANSITVVPGTLTLRLRDDEYLVQALVPAAADDLLTAKMQNMIGAFFLEEPEDPPEITWLDPEEAVT